MVAVGKICALAMSRQNRIQFFSMIWAKKKKNKAKSNDGIIVRFDICC